MKTTTFALLSVVGSATAQGVTGKISPTGNAPDGCTTNFDGKFQLTLINPASKRDVAIERRASCDGALGSLVVTLKDGQLFDAQSRTGYIASNFQFQFDGPPQAGAIFTAGFTACKNNLLAFGANTTFFSCASGTFGNLYDRNWAAQCAPVQLSIQSCNAGAAAGGAGQIGDGQVIGTTTATTTIVRPISDGQPQVVTTVVPIPLCQISDGQLQVHTTPCASITSAPRPTTTAVPISQLSDGQIQVTPGVGGAPPPPVTVGSSAATRTSGPAPTAPPATGTTLRTSASSGSAPATQTRSSTASTPTTSGTTVSGAGTVEMGSLAALAVGILGAVWVL